MTAPILLAVFLASPAPARESKPYVVFNGRGVVAHSVPAAAPAPAPVRSQAIAATKAEEPAGEETESSRGFSRGWFSGFAPLALRRPSFHASRSAADDPVPPEHTSPGALIRTAGQLPRYSDAGPAGTASVEAGAIALDDANAHDVARSNGIAWARPDRSSFAGASGGGVTANIDSSDSSF